MAKKQKPRTAVVEELGIVLKVEKEGSIFEVIKKEDKSHHIVIDKKTLLLPLKESGSNGSSEIIVEVTKCIGGLRVKLNTGKQMVVPFKTKTWFAVPKGKEGEGKTRFRIAFPLGNVQASVKKGLLVSYEIK